MQVIKQIKILFLGQCLVTGHDSVKRSETYVSLVQSMLKTRFPAINFKFYSEAFYHPSSLMPLLKQNLPSRKPDITIIMLPALFATRTQRISITAQIAPDFGQLARSFIQKIDARLGTGRKIEALLDKGIFSMPHVVKPPLSIDEYQCFVEAAIDYCHQDNRSIVLMGPGRFNEDNKERNSLQSPEIWSDVQQMVLKIGKKYQLPVINSQESLAEHDGKIFITDSHRFSHYGHKVVAREIEYVLANEITKLISFHINP